MSDLARSTANLVLMAKPTLLLYPGAGTGCDHPSLLVTERRLSPKALVERRDFPYRRHGRTAPDRAPKLMAAIRDDLAGFSRRRGPIVMGGPIDGRADNDHGGPADVDKMGRGRAPCWPGAGLLSHSTTGQARHAARRASPADLGCRAYSSPARGTRSGLRTSLSSGPRAFRRPWSTTGLRGGRHDLRGADNEIAERVATFLGSVTR